MRVLQKLGGRTQLKGVYFGAKKLEIQAWLFHSTHFHELFEDPVVCTDLKNFGTKINVLIPFFHEFPEVLAYLEEKGKREL